MAAGGGTRNTVLMARIASLCATAVVTTTDDYGLPSQAKESFAFALLGFLTWHGLPGTAPGATGARQPSLLTPGLGPLRPPSPAAVVPRRLILR